MRKSDKIQLELLALKFRQEQGVKFDEPVSVHQMLRNKNIITSFQPLSEGFEGMAIKIPNKEQEARLFMLVNVSRLVTNFIICSIRKILPYLMM